MAREEKDIPGEFTTVTCVPHTTRYPLGPESWRDLRCTFEPFFGEKKLARVIHTGSVRFHSGDFPFHCSVDVDGVLDCYAY